MNMNVKSAEAKKNTKKVQFNMTDEDTCMRTWNFDLEEKNGEIIILDSNIEFTKQGCNGHPKTISALIKERKASDIDLEALMDTTCFRKQSCGMTLAACVEAINNM